MALASLPSNPTRRKSGDTRARVLEVARRLFITRGIDAVSYGDIAKEVGSTRANLHYHFGNKSELVKEVFAETFQEVRASLEAIWLKPGLSLDERIDLLFEDARTRFEEFNQPGDELTPWSLSSRARFDFSAVDTEVVEGIGEMSRYFEECVTHAVRLAIGAGEFRADTPVKDVVLMITPLWYFGSPITQFSGIKRLKNHYEAAKRIIRAAYGARAG
ncbi:transcriptional regulator, TetR family [Marinobacter daqiaonensis]|uniref:Transcriptional regulator, TetR family n=1 Tax=Marinobacter daqiaonensis TaxID=650891 RepID=A0A1I6H0L1_9GAMM|nr:TetR/AcrR family transcriptional regulator [Marinobacter daqiaonensis]SFR47988.1 transcriptional regulator, TetR family [Marinobacter daqiaonensis]